MGRQGNHPSPSTVNSSIALLQERLRKLEKVKDVEAKLSKFILMMPKTQVKNQESNKF